MSADWTPPAEAVEAACVAAALDRNPHYPWDRLDASTQALEARHIKAAFIAAYPAIVAAERERIAQAILAQCDDLAVVPCRACRQAARIARTGVTS